MEKRKSYSSTTEELIKIVGAGVLILGVSTPVTIENTPRYTSVSAEAAFIPEDQDWLPNDKGVIRK